MPNQTIAPFDKLFYKTNVKDSTVSFEYKLGEKKSEVFKKLKTEEILQYLGMLEANRSVFFAMSLYPASLVINIDVEDEWTDGEILSANFDVDDGSARNLSDYNYICVIIHKAFFWFRVRIMPGKALVLLGYSLPEVNIKKIAFKDWKLWEKTFNDWGDTEIHEEESKNYTKNFTHVFRFRGETVKKEITDETDTIDPTEFEIGMFREDGIKIRAFDKDLASLPYKLHWTWNWDRVKKLLYGDTKEGKNPLINLKI